MNLLPIAVRELRLAARRPGAYYWRCLTAGLAIAITLALLMTSFHGMLPPARAGLHLFYALSVIGFAYAVGEGAQMGSDSLSREKREGTMGLLFLTNLKGYDIVLGKLVSRSSHALFGLWAAIPVPAIGFLLGGVALGDYIQMMFVLMNTLLYALSLGILVSALSRNERTAMASAVILGVVLTILIPILGFWHSKWARLAGIHPAFVVFSPAGPWLSSLGPSAGLLAPGYFIPSLLATFASSLGFLTVASLALPHLWQDERQAVPQRWRRWFGRFRAKAGLGARSVPERRCPKGTNPLVWLAARQRRSPVVLWVALAMILCITGWYSRDAMMAVIMMTAVMLHASLLLKVANVACRSIAEDRESGALELLLTTPLDEDEITAGRLIALKQELMRPALAALAVDLVFCLWVAWFDQQAATFLKVFFGLAVLWVIQLLVMYPLAWFGLWMGLRCPNALSAVRRTQFSILMMPYIVYLVIIPVLVAISGLFGGKRFEFDSQMAVLIAGAVLLPLSVPLGFCAKAISELRDNFRKTASEPAEKSETISRGWIKRLFWRRA
jgi:ABC-type Na+ efflux pump permease subunit